MDVKNNCVFNTKLNNVKHEFEVYLDNNSSDTDSSIYGINPNSIVNLTIQDTLADWVVQGHMTFFFNPEARVSTYNSKTGQITKAATGLPGANNVNTFTFRGDGNDLLRIRISPKFDSGTSNNLLTLNNDPSFWTISHLFSIYDMEDIDLPPGAQNAASAHVKCLKVYFWDFLYQKLLTNTLEYSTALSPLAKVEEDKQSQIYSNYGNIPTGQALYEIFNNTIKDVPKLSTKYLAEPNTEEWDIGAAKIFYTAPAFATANDSFKYVLDKHTSAVTASPSESTTSQNTNVGTPSINDVCVLQKERGPLANDLGYVTLKSLGSYFEKAGSGGDSPGEYQYEHYFLQEYDSRNTPSKNHRAPLSTNNGGKSDLKPLKYNQITNYRFVDISSIVNATQFCTTPVYSFDFSKRLLNVEFQNNSVTTARKFIGENYIKNLYKGGGDGNSLFLITLDKDKKDKNIKPTFSNYGDNPLLRQYAGLQKLLYIGVFQNACINFRTLGLTYRESGRFIGIDKLQGTESGAFEDKFYGQWFIIDIKHVIESEMYYNDITAIKIHRHVPLPFTFKDTLTE